MRNTPAGISHGFGVARTFFREDRSVAPWVRSHPAKTEETPRIAKNTTSGKGAERARMVRNEGAVKSTKIQRSNLPEINAGKRPPSRGKTPAVVSKSHKLAIPGRPRHLRTHTCERSLARSRVLPLVGGQSGYKARRKRDECREESHRVSGVEIVEGEGAREQRRKEKEKEQASGTEKL